MKHDGDKDKDKKEVRKEFTIVEETLLFRGAVPFVLRHAWARGVLQMLQSLLGILFMLAIMQVYPSFFPLVAVNIVFRRTFQVGFILSLVVGQAIGEMMYGRYMSG